MKFSSMEVISDLTIIGGGMSGICAAIEAARSGLKVSLINNRGYLGGNASPEIRIDICGADGACEFNFYAREGGILEELRLENLYRNPQGNVYLWHTILLDWVYREKNISLFLNTNIDEVILSETKLDKIELVAGSQLGSEKHFKFISPYFVDDTGDGTIGYLSGASYRLGREARSEFNERIAPVDADDATLLSTLSFYSKDTKREAPFVKPNFIDNDIVSDALANREIPDRIPGHSRYEGYRMQWFYETGYGRHPITDSEEIVQDHRELVYSVWDHIKNSGIYDSSTYDLEYVSAIPGKRESRRLIGDHILNANDIVDQVDFEDVIGHGGWSIDLHAKEGFFSTDMTTHHYNLRGVYGIPFRSCYSKDVENLFVASRCMSTTHVAFGSTRVMATLSTVGQAVGKAANICLTNNITPRDLANNSSLLQQELLKNDQHILGHKNDDEEDVVKTAKIQTSSTKDLSLTNNIEEESLEKSLAIIIPTKSYIEYLDVYLKNNIDTTLEYQIFETDKAQNYNPKVKLATKAIALTASKDFRWIRLPIELDINNGKTFIELINNRNIELATTTDKLNGVISLFRQNFTHETTYVDIVTHKVKTSQWAQLDTNICFRVAQTDDIYNPCNINNGYNRNHILPNIWISDPSEETSEVTLSLDGPKELNQLQFTFDSNLNMFYDNLEVAYDFNIMPTLVKDYKVYAKTETGFKEIAHIKNNHQRVNRINFETIKTEEIKIELTETNGSPSYSIYEIRGYKY